MIPHVTQWDKADITELEKFRKRAMCWRRRSKKLDVKITAPLIIYYEGRC